MTGSVLSFPRLKRNEQSGSKPRCHLLTHGSDQEVATRLSELCAPFATVSPADQWMPRGFEAIGECQLHRRSRVLDSALCDRLAAWWLPADQLSDRTPNFDIAATCLVEQRPGMLLVEAKAYDKELIGESGGRKVRSGNPKEQQSLRDSSRETIGVAIDAARVGLSAQTGLSFGISRDSCYQMSNRFAWEWKLADSGLPVVLVYLGFLSADDMARYGRPFRSHDDWERLVRSQSVGVVPEAIWNRKWIVRGQPFLPIIRSITQPLVSYPTL